jgi:hypothetical protein
MLCLTESSNGGNTSITGIFINFPRNGPAAMLNTTLEVEENYHNFLRPVIHESIRRILQFYGLQGIAQIYYNGENEIANLVGANQQDSPFASRYTDMLFRNKLYIVPEITHSDFNTGYGNSRRAKTEQPVWMTGEGEDKINITPCFAGVKIDVDVLANFNSKRSAEQFVDQLNRIRDESMVDINFSGTTHLVMNTPIISMLGDIHGLIKKSEPDTPEFSEWFYGNTTRPFTVISNVAGNHKRVVTPMKLNNIGLYFSDPVVQLAKKVENFGKYEVSFKYFFFFQRHTHWDLQYPLNVYQDQIPDKWVPRPDPGYAQPFDVNVNPEWLMISGFTTERAMQGPYFLKIPNYDPWAMERRPWIQPVVQARLAVEDVPSQVLLNIFDLPGFVWNQSVKDYMLRRKDYVFSHHDSPFLVMVYSGNIQVDPTQLVMDELGNVTLTRAPTMKNTHRAVVVLDYAIRDYSDNFWNDLYVNQDNLIFLPAIFPWYRWDQLPMPWLDHIGRICKEIDLGTGRPTPYFNGYMTSLGLKAYNLLEYKPHGTGR